jgi:hypothetical protein
VFARASRRFGSIRLWDITGFAKHSRYTGLTFDRAIGGPWSGTIEEQQLVLDENGLGHHGTRADGPGQSGDHRHQMQKKDGEIANRTIVSTSRP